jgi:hypothetical protein
MPVRKVAILAVAGAAALAVLFAWRHLTLSSQPTSIIVSASACYGTCPDFKVTAVSDGRFIFEGREFVKRTGRVEVPLSERAYAKFVEKLAWIRPKTSSAGFEDKCPVDIQYLEVQWKQGPITATSLLAGHDCQIPGNNEALSAISDALGAIGIERFIGTPQERASPETEWMKPTASDKD